jgi:Chaperone of endosialidase
LANGNVGIGTTLPSQALDISYGNTYIHGAGSYPQIGGIIKPYIIPGVVGGLQINSVQTNGTEISAISISDSGYVGIGTNIPLKPLHIYQSSQAYIQFQTSGQTNIIGTNSSDRAFYIQNSTGGVFLRYNEAAWSGYSDIRIKKNIEQMDSMINKITKLNPVCFHWKSQEETENKNYGLIAQEVENVFPDLVNNVSGTEELPNLKGMSYTNFIPILIKAFQEQQAQINALKAHLNL